MTLGNLSVPSMVGISSAWINPDEDRPIFEQRPMLASLLPEIDKVHQDLIRIQVTSSSIAKELKQLSVQAGRFDEVHDRKLRGIYGVLTALAELADTPEQAEQYLNLRDELFPDGQRMVQNSYLDEAGNVALVEGRLDETRRKALAAIPVPDSNLNEQLVAWIEAGKALGNVERRRAQLAEEKEDRSISRSDVNRARQHWIRVVQVVQQLVQIMTDLDDSTRSKIVQPLQNAEAKADRSRRERTVTSEEEEIGEGDDVAVAEE